MTVEELRLILRINGASAYTHTINKVTNVTNNYSNSIGGLTSMLAKFISAGFMAKFTKDCIEAASNLQEVSNVMNVTFGRNAGLIDKWAKTQAASFGLSEKAGKEYAGLYGTMAKQFNITLDRATKMSIELTKLTGDVASFYNTTDKIASTKLKSIFTGETESLKELGVVMTETNLNAYALSKGIGKTVNQMSEQEKVLLRYGFVVEKLQHTQGDFQRTSDGWANSVRILKLNLENLRVEIGTQLLPVAGQGLAAINAGLQAVAPTLVSIAQTIRLYGEAWKNASDTTKATVKTAMAALAVAVVAPKVISVVGHAVEILTAETLTLGTAISAVAGIAGIVLAAVALNELSKQVQELKQNETSIGESAEISADSVDELSTALDGLGDSAQGLNSFLASFDEVNKVGGNESLMSSLVNTDDLANILAAANGLDDLNSMVDELNSSIAGMSLGDISTDTFLDPAWWGTKWEGVKAYFDTFWTGEWKENWLTGFDMIGEWFEESFPEWTTFWEKVGAKIYDFFKPIFDILDAISNKANDLANSFVNSDWFKFWERAGENIVGPDKGAPKRIEGNGGSAFHRRSAGGFPNKGSLFIAGETGPELVSNFGGSQTRVVNQSQMGGASQVPIILTPTFVLNGRTIAAAVIDDVNNTTRSTGNSPFIQVG